MQLVDYVKSLKGYRVVVYTKASNKFAGVLKFVDKQMNIVLAQAVEIYKEQHENEPLGEVLVRGSAITTIQADCDCKQKLSKLVRV